MYYIHEPLLKLYFYSPTCLNESAMKPSHSLQTYFSKTALYLVVGLLAAMVLLVIPATDNFLFHTKSFVVFLGALLLVGVFTAQALVKKSFEFTLSPFTAGLLFFGFASIAATFFTQSYPVENLLNFGGVYIALSLLILVGGSILPKESKHWVLTTLAISSALLVVTQLAQMVGFGPAHAINQLVGLQLPTTLLFNLAGSPLVALEIIGLSVLAMVVQVVSTRFIPKVYVVTLPILIIGLLINTWAVLPGKVAPLSLPSYTASWSVALDAIRSPRAALIGTGPASYQNMYLQFKPLWVNNTPNWNIQFSQAANLPLTLIATTGFLGLISWIVLNLKVVASYRAVGSENKSLLALFLGSTLITLFLPANVGILLIQAVALAALIAANADQYPNLSITPLKVSLYKKVASLIHGEKLHSNTLFSLSAGIVMLALVYVIFLTGRAYAAHVQLFRSDLAASQDKAVEVYELQQAAVRYNPYLDLFRRRYAGTNLLIAIALSNKADLTDAEKEQIPELLQQAIREARGATLLDPTDTQNWQILAQIYQNMIGVTDDAQEWTVQSYVQAIQTNPNDPVLRLNLGNVFVAAKQYEQAAGIFSQAVSIKPDYAPSYFQLARVLKELNQLEQAKTAYQEVLTLLPPNTDEYTLVTKELEDVEKLLEEKAKTTDAEEDDDGTTELQRQTGINTPSITDQALEATDQEIVKPKPQVELQDETTTTDTNTTPESTPSASPAQ